MKGSKSPELEALVDTPQRRAPHRRRWLALACAVLSVPAFLLLFSLALVNSETLRGCLSRNTLDRHSTAFGTLTGLTSIKRLGSTASCAFSKQASNVDHLPDLYEATITELQDGLDRGLFTSVDLTNAYLKRIDEVNLQGPKLRAVIATSPVALREAGRLDALRRSGIKLSPLHGIPILIKDNIATRPADGMDTTAGSYALKGSVVQSDARVIELLRGKGAIILGKANLSQWAHFRGDMSNMINGWSSIGGQCTSPYFPSGDPSGSSGGSGVAVSIGLCAAALGTDTGGSVVSPASVGNQVGVRPTVGLLSRHGVVPISSHLDTVGPMARSVMDAAILLSILAGPDRADNYTLAQPLPVPDFAANLTKKALEGVRLGVPKSMRHDPLADDAAVERGFSMLKKLGATLIETDLDLAHPHNDWVAEADFKYEIAAYFQALASNPSGVRTLEQLRQFNLDHADLEMPPTYESMTVWEAALRTDRATDKHYLEYAWNNTHQARKTIDDALKRDRLSAFVFPSAQLEIWPAAQYPQVTVPLGFLPNDQEASPVLNEAYDPPIKYTVPIYRPFPGMPFGLTFAGTAWSEASLLSYAYAFEQATHHRLERKAYAAAVPKTQLKDVIPRGRWRPWSRAFHSPRDMA